MTNIIGSVNNQISTQTAVEILNNVEAFDSLSQEAKAFILQYAVVDNYKKNLQRKAELATLDYEELKAMFLDGTNSAHTRDAYLRALSRLEMFVRASGKSFTEMSPLDADRYIQSNFLCKPIVNGVLNVGAEGRSPSSIRRDVACVSAFYTFVSRCSNNAIVNPFRGTKMLPKKKASRACIVPTERDVLAILGCKKIPKALRAVIALMALAGLRVGGIPKMEIDYEKDSIRTFSKGKDYCVDIVYAYTLDGRSLIDFLRCFDGVKKPFMNLTDNRIKAQVHYWLGKLVKEGVISQNYHPHSFRHFFAIKHYEEHKDIYALKKLLNHTSISVTESYLKGLHIL